MREVPLTIPEIGMINSTRFIIGTGAGMLLAGKMDRSARTAVGVALIAVGTLISIPVAMAFFGKLRGGPHLTDRLPERGAA